MPLGKTRGQYGELGHWGKRPGRRFSKRKILLLGTLLSLAIIFAISHNGNILPIVNAGDYNTTFSHTRTLIFGDTQFNGPTGAAGGNPAFVSVVNASCINGSCANSLAMPGLSVQAGDTIVIAISDNGQFNAFSTTDTQTNSYTQRVSSITGLAGLAGQSSHLYTAIAASTGTDTITTTATGTQSWSEVASNYRGAIGFGNTATNQNDASTVTGSSTVTITVGGTSSIVIETLAVSQTGPGANAVHVSLSSSQNLRNRFTSGGTLAAAGSDVSGLSGSNSLTISFTGVDSGGTNVCPTCTHSQSALELTFSPFNFAAVRWNTNSTCVTLHAAGQPRVDFDWSKGTAGSGGANCNSANMMISKSQVNFQTAAGRDLEIIWQAESLNTSNTQSIDLVFRTNSTLPKFTENYNPFNDTQARLIYEACTRFSTSCGGSGQTVYIQHDPNKSIFAETRGNDFVVSGAAPDLKNNAPVYLQAVLNFTGPINYINEQTSVSTTNNSNNTASALQMGESYNILIKVNTIGSPQGVAAASVGNAFGPGPNGIPAPLSIWSVPPSCSDNVNRVVCGLATPQPVFQFNPLDPSSWGNAIIQGLLWVFAVAVPTALLIIARVLLQVIQITFNFVGNQFGWGNIGDNIVTFLNGLPSLFGQIGTALGWLASIVSSVINTIIIANLLANPYFAGLVNLLNDFKNVLTSGLIINFLTQIAFWFPTSYMIILITSYFLFVFLKGLHGFFDWIHLVRWSAFEIIGLFSLFIYTFGKLITAILGRLSIISPGHEFPKIPHPNPGSLPKISLGGEVALFDDPTAWFLAFTGFIFTMMWAGTSAAGLPANTQTIIQSFTTLFLTLFGVGFMILLLYIPGFLLAKLYQKGIVS